MSLDELAPPEGGGDLSGVLFERYCAGGASAQEWAAIEAWMARHPEERVWYGQVRAALVAGDFAGVSEADVDRQIEAILRRVRGAARQRDAVSARRTVVGARLAGMGGSKGQAPRHRGWYTLTAFVAAATLLIAGWKFGGISLAGHGVIPGSPSTTYTTYATTDGHQATIILSDSNIVELNVASRLEVPTDYSAGNHVLHVPVGAALFTVSHHAGTPFTVVAGATTVRVLGTIFSVRHYPTDTGTTVAVEEGKVRVGARVLTARQLIEVLPRGPSRVRGASEADFSFATGTLSIGFMPLAEAIPELDRWYNADVRLGDTTLARRHIKGDFEVGRLSDLSNILEMTFDVRVVRHGRVLTLYPGTPR